MLEIKFVLVETSRPGNVGAAARAIKTMGFTQLVLVRPRFSDIASQPEAVAFASGAQDVLEAAQVVDSIEAALSGCHFAAAISARLREFSPPVITPRTLAKQLGKGFTGKIALVFGNERFGLPNEIVEKCNVLINIPANPAYSSLNLAQAVQILAYECGVDRMLATGKSVITADALPRPLPKMAVSPRVNFHLSDATQSAIDTLTNSDMIPTQDLEAGAISPSESGMQGAIGFHGELAELSQIDAMFNHLEEALVAINFLNPTQPKKLMSRLRRLFARAQLETEEVNILRGIAKQILQTKKT